MRCPECGAEMTASAGDVLLDRKLPGVWLRDVPTFACACGERAFSIPRPAPLLRAVAAALDLAVLLDEPFVSLAHLDWLARDESAEDRDVGSWGGWAVEITPEGIDCRRAGA